MGRNKQADFLRIEVGPYLARIVKIEDVEAGRNTSKFTLI